MSTHPRTLGRAWLRPALVAPRRSAVPETAPPPQPRSEPAAPAVYALELVPTTLEALRRLGLLVHTLTRDETAAWNAEDPGERAEARRAIRDAVREQGGGELRDHRGRVIERI